MQNSDFADQTPFVVRSKLDNRVLEMDSNGQTTMHTFEDGNVNQQWIITDLGNQWMNVGQMKPLQAGHQGRSFILGTGLYLFT